MLNALYTLVNVIPLPFWFLMIVLPNRAITRRVANTYTVFLVMGVLYVVTLIGAGVTAMNSSASGGAPMNFATAEGLAAQFSSPIAALVVWLHMLTLDLMAGHWIYHESQRLNAPRLLTGISLFFAFMAGPLGVLIFVAWRTFATRAASDVPQYQPTR